MFILASHDIALAYALMGGDADWSSRGNRGVARRARSFSAWTLGEALAWLVTIGYCLAALRLG